MYPWTKCTHHWYTPTGSALFMTVRECFPPETLKIILDKWIGSSLTHHILKTMLKILFSLFMYQIKELNFHTVYSLINIAKKKKKTVQHVSFSHLICSSNLIHTQYFKVEKKSPLRLHCEHLHYNVTMNWWNSLTLVLSRWEVHGIHSHMSNLGIQSTRFQWFDIRLFWSQYK